LGASFSKFQGVLRLVSQIIPANNLQKIENAADDKESAPKARGTNGVELQGVYSPLPLLNSENLLSQNKTDHLQLNRLHYLSKMGRREALWRTINILTKIFLAPNECLLMLNKKIIMGKWFKS
jgi:hypothetical protein